MKFNNPYWGNKTKIELLEKWILAHSYIYYELNQNIITDQVFDNNCKQLIKLSQLDRQAFEKSKYYNAFKEFDGSTGFDLYRKLKTIYKDAVRNAALLTIQAVKRRKPYEG